MEATPQGKLFIFSAPSGAGKTTLVHEMLHRFPSFAFSVSATTRPPRSYELDGRDYHFISEDEFRSRVAAGEFLEHEEVYPGRFYGTLRSEVDAMLANGKHVVLDVDVQGGLHIKEAYGNRALSIFVQPPSVEELRRRLLSRGTETAETVDTRCAKAEYELTFAPQFDRVIVNDVLEKAVLELERMLRKEIAENRQQMTDNR